MERRVAGPGPNDPLPIRLLRVLIVDDCPDTTDTTAELVALWGHDTRRAYAGADAVEIAADYRPDAMVVDLTMGVVDGYEVARRVRRLPGVRGALMIAVTGQTEPGYRQRAAAAGFDYYLLKPMDPNTLEALLMSRQIVLSTAPARNPVGPAACRILVVDDDDGGRRFLAAGLQREGFVVWAAANGQEAVDLLRSSRSVIDVVLMDVRMPGSDGPETLIALRRQAPELRCCFMSGDTGAHTEDELRKRGTSQLLRKPFSIAEAGRVLREEVRRRDEEEAAQDDRWRDDEGQGQRGRRPEDERAPVDDPVAVHVPDDSQRSFGRVDDSKEQQ